MLVQNRDVTLINEHKGKRKKGREGGMKSSSMRPHITV